MAMAEEGLAFLQQLVRADPEGSGQVTGMVDCEHGLPMDGRDGACGSCESLDKTYPLKTPRGQEWTAFGNYTPGMTAWAGVLASISMMPMMSGFSSAYDARAEAVVAALYCTHHVRVGGSSCVTCAEELKKKS